MQNIHVVVDLVYGEEGNPGIKAFWNENDARAEEKRLLADDTQHGNYIVILETITIEHPSQGPFEHAARSAGWQLLSSLDEDVELFWQESSERFSRANSWEELCRLEGISLLTT